MSRKSKAVETPAIDHDYDSPEGVRAALKAALAGDITAAETLARRLSWIIAGESPYSEAEIESLIGVAESGWNSILGHPECHPEDMYQFAVDILWDDEGGLIIENAENGAAWMLRSAEGGLPDAQLEVGRFYYEGVGLKQSDKLAAEWFKKASSDKLNAEHASFFLSEIKKKAGKASAKKAPAKKAVAKKPAAKVVKKAPAKTAKAPAKKAAVKKPVAKAPAKKVVAKKSAKPVAKAKVVAKAKAKAPVKPAAKPVVKKKPAAKVAAKPVKKAPAKRK